MTQKQDITAIIYDKKGRPLSIGKNSYVKTHTYQANLANKLGLQHKIYLHAEIEAILRLKRTDRPYRIMIARLNASGEEMTAKPCPICAHALALAGIKKIDHT